MKYFIFISIFLVVWLSRFHSPIQLAATDLVTTGTIASLVETHERHIEFLFIPVDNTDYKHQKIWLSWYAPPPVHLHAGDEWQLHIHLHPTQKSWLLTQHINAVGTVKFDFKNQLIEKHSWKYFLLHLREKIYLRLKHTLTPNEGLGFISALTIGMRDNISNTEWEDLRGTGTNHLMAIAGLHIGFVSSMAYILINFLWRRSVNLMLFKPAQEAAILGALIAAFLYSALSGFSLPAQRAMIMLSVFLITSLLRHKISPWSSYFFALAIILILEPLSVLTSTFGLSFMAVGLLIYSSSNRIATHGFWHHATHAQWIMAIGLMPLSFLFFQQVSFTGFIANCIAVPFVGFIILPLCLLGILFSYCWKIAGFLLIHFWPLIHWLAHFPYSQWYQKITYPELISTLIAIFLLLAPRGFPYRWMGCWGLLPLLLHHNTYL